MKFANKSLYKVLKDGGLDVAKLSLRRQIEIVTLYLTWVHIFLTIWQLCVDFADGVSSVLNMFWSFE
ncbi:hypothetical protein KR018_009298 [Drosophila ironensis]|nr:hypothetical protein KR018_009298 [Drosophila ironensis]